MRRPRQPCHPANCLPPCLCKQMMIRMGVKVTPYFALYRNGERVHGHGGVNEANLHKAIQAHVRRLAAGADCKWRFCGKGFFLGGGGKLGPHALDGGTVPVQ